MNETPPPSSPDEAPETFLWVPTRLRRSPWWPWPQRVVLLAVGVLLPAVWFFFARDRGPSWQSGSLSDYADILLSWKPALPFWPFLLYSMTCFTLVVVRPERFVGYAAVRAGVYTGVWLAVHYFCVLALVMGSGGIVAIMIAAAFGISVSVLAFWAIGALCYRYGDNRVFAAFLVVGVFMLPLCAFVAVFSFVCATPWAVLAYTAVAVRLVADRASNRFQFSLAWLLGLVTWFAAYLGAWRLAIQITLAEYAKLPTEAPPDCYVATAAARGHRRWVRAEPCRTAAGQSYLANDQMRRLKALELILARLCPPVHRACRGVYDRLGPVAARLLVHPLLADAAYAALKPAEWAAWAALRLLLPKADRSVGRLYRLEEPGS